MKQRLATGKESSGDGTRSRIIQVALELFAEFGFAGVSTRKIADEARCNCASVCYYFGGKKKLYIECLQQLTLEGNSGMKEILQRPEDKQDFELRLLDFSEVFTKYTSDNRASIKLLMNEINAKKKLPIKSSLFQDIDGMLGGFLLESQIQGIIRKDIDTAFSSKMILSTILGQKLCKVFTPSDEVNDREFAKKLLRSCTFGFYCQ